MFMYWCGTDLHAYHGSRLKPTGHTNCVMADLFVSIMKKRIQVRWVSWKFSSRTTCSDWFCMNFGSIMNHLSILILLVYLMKSVVQMSSFFSENKNPRVLPWLLHSWANDCWWAPPLPLVHYLSLCGPFQRQNTELSLKPLSVKPAGTDQKHTMPVSSVANASWNEYLS